MISAWGIEHTEISKGLPSAVKAGGGGNHGSWLRMKNQAGKTAARHKYARNLSTKAGKDIKEGVEHSLLSRRVDLAVAGKSSRSKRAGLLNEDIANRQKGWRSGKTSALDRGYRGRVSKPMTPLP